MAIIRIKRTGGTAAPSGLTFGELAFVGATAGVTAERVYIGGIAGDSIWIGARILNNVPNTTAFFSGTTADTTIPTVRGMRDFVSSLVGATAFSSDINVVLTGTKSFGRFQNGATITATGKTPIQVILDALTEYIPITAQLALHSATQPSGSHPVSAGGAGYSPTTSYIPYGATGNRTLGTIAFGTTYTYNINTPGFTALGATLEWQRSSSDPRSLNTGWQALVGTFFDNNGADGFVTSPSAGTPGTTQGFGVTGIGIIQWDQTPIHFRYTVRDVSDLVGTPNGITYAYVTLNANSTQIQQFVNPTVSVSATGVRSTTSYSIPTGWSAATGTLRERGDTGTSVNASLQIGAGMYSEYHWLSRVGIQYSNDNGTTWYWTNNTTGTPVMLSTPQVGVTGTTFTISSPVQPIGAGAGLTSMMFRFFVNEGLTLTSATNGITLTVPSSSSTYVSFRKRIFYGATASVPTNAAAVRSLPMSLMGPTSGTAFANTSPLTFAFDGGSNLTPPFHYVIALPRGLTLNDSTGTGVGVQTPSETLAGNSNPANDACQQRNGSTTPAGATQANDAMGVAHDYTIYSWQVGLAYDPGTPITVRCNGTVISGLTA